MNPSSQSQSPKLPPPHTHTPDYLQFGFCCSSLIVWVFLKISTLTKSQHNWYEYDISPLPILPGFGMLKYKGIRWWISCWIINPNLPTPFWGFLLLKISISSQSQRSLKQSWSKTSYISLQREMSIFRSFI